MRFTLCNVGMRPSKCLRLVPGYRMEFIKSVTVFQKFLQTMIFFFKICTCCHQLLLLIHAVENVNSNNLRKCCIWLHYIIQFNTCAFD